MLRTQASDEEADDVFSRRYLYYGRAGSDVMGCRRPRDGVFTYVNTYDSSDTSHAECVYNIILYCIVLYCLVNTSF